MRNLRLDDDRLVWSDEYSGHYLAPPRGYSLQLDLRWAQAQHDDA